MFEVSNTVFLGYLTIGLILGLILTTFVFEGNDVAERSMVLILATLLWGIVVPCVITGLFFAGAIKAADWLKVKLTPYFMKAK